MGSIHVAEPVEAPGRIVISMSDGQPTITGGVVSGKVAVKVMERKNKLFFTSKCCYDAKTTKLGTLGPFL